MSIRTEILPPHCYSQNEITVEGGIIHYYSAVNVDPDNKFDYKSCRRLMIDLNRPVDERQWYKMEDLKNRVYASYHYMVPREGDPINLVPPTKRAWHAGESTMMGRDDCNSWTIGISLLATHTSGFTENQYKKAVEICYKHGLRSNTTWGHEDVAPNRKKDPGPKFEWQKFNKMLDLKY